MPIVDDPECRVTFTTSIGDINGFRWQNPDGSKGGVVGRGAIIHKSAIIEDGATVWPWVKIGPRAVIKAGANVFEGEIGSHMVIPAGADVWSGPKIKLAGEIGTRPHFKRRPTQSF